MTSVCPAETDNDFFEAQVRPVLIKHCLQCHGTRKQEGGLRLDSRAGWMQGGDRGVTIVPGKPSESLLIQAVQHEDANLQMPPSKPLDLHEIAALKEWVSRGAPDPRTAEPTTGTSTRLDVKGSRSFWSFQKLHKPAIPINQSDDWSLNPIDSFILAQLREQGILPVSDTDRRTLIRRATFDLTGLPPTPREINAFLSDESPDAFANLLDRLLDSEAYGERWGRHWLDVARYADTAGDGADYPVREAYKYRDWVIRAFNDDMPYDQFTREQLAGDLLPGSTTQQKVASGYNRLLQTTHDGGLQLK
ncbi:MAG: DUF1549 domain-containing protein, partial [Rubripirellula sp.]